MNTARAEPSDALHRDGILEAVAFTAERLLLSADWREAADEVLARLGQAAGVSRAYIAKNVVWDDGRLASTWLAEWTLPDVVRVMDDPEFRSAPWDEVFGRWSEILARGEVVMGAVASMPEIERPPLLSHGVVSLAKFPVFVDGEWWGAIGFDDCDGVRDWTGDELAALRASATVLGAAVQRQRLNGQALDAETRYREFVEKLPAVTYLDVLDEGVVRVGYISPQVEEVFGYPAERFTRDPNFWLSIVHPDDRARVEETGTVRPHPHRPLRAGVPDDRRRRSRHLGARRVHRDHGRDVVAAHLAGIPGGRHLAARDGGTARGERGALPVHDRSFARRDPRPRRREVRLREPRGR